MDNVQTPGGNTTTAGAVEGLALAEGFEAEQDGDTFTIRFPDGHAITARANGQLIVTKAVAGFAPFDVSVAALQAHSLPGDVGTEAEAWLRAISSWLLANDHDMKLPSGVLDTDPLDIADRLAATKGGD